MPSPPFIDLGPIIGGLKGALIGPTVTMTGTKELQAKLDTMAKQFGSPGRFLRAAALTYRSFMVQNYLSGQRLARRTGRLAGAWQPERVSQTVYRLAPGRLPYSRVHEYGLDYPFQPVRGYTTRSGRKVKLYLRHMRLKPTHYVTDTVINAEQLVGERLDQIAANIVKGTAQKEKDDV